MKKITFFLIIILLLSIIICNDINKSQKPKKKKQKHKDKKNKGIKTIRQEENIEEKEEKEKVKEEEEKEEEVKEEENYNEKFRGIYMTDKAYYRKINKIFEERGLKGKKKIAKEKLKTIFDEIYGDEKDNDDDSDSDGQQEGNNSKTTDLFFNEIFKSYDHDDYINLKGIKKLMSPKNVQDAMFTVYVDMAGSLGYL